VAAELYPTQQSCESCHDGVAFRRATFSIPTPQPSNLVFDHIGHATAVTRGGDPALACGTCHTTPDAPRMTVQPLEAERCLTCHAPPQAEHLDAMAPCTTCHVPLAESALPRERIAALEVPPDHDEEGFSRELHGQLVVREAQRCATCHTRERCVGCHVDANRPEMSLVPPAPPGMELPPAAAEYPVPESHRSPWFRTEHSAVLEAEGESRCATCHTREDCASCHLEPLPSAARSLPPRASVVAPGARLQETAPASHEVPSFERIHGTLSAADPTGCASCHSQPFCTQCHQAPERPVFHDAGFLASHASAAWRRSLECSSCHEVQVFCRSCHLQSGFGARQPLGTIFHDAEPLWLLRHGQPARQALESCTSCHAQKDCLQCHSQSGGFRVNPHGPGFDARRAWERSPAICSACHSGTPFRKPG
jgi:hypothetical protein